MNEPINSSSYSIILPDPETLNIPLVCQQILDSRVDDKLDLDDLFLTDTDLRIENDLPFFCAILKRNVELVEFLLNRGVDPNLTTIPSGKFLREYAMPEYNSYVVNSRYQNYQDFLLYVILYYISIEADNNSLIILQKLIKYGIELNVNKFDYLKCNKI